MSALIIALLEHCEQHQLVKSCLEQSGREVLIVDSYERARAVIEQHAFDLILSDVHLENGGTVFDFLIWLRSHPKLSAVPFVLFSLQPTPRAKYLADGVRTAARHLGATKYISMERFDPLAFEREIAAMLGSSSIAQVVEKVIE